MSQYKDQLENFDEREVDRVEAIVRSMTPAERTNPKILNGSRRARIAKGAGTTVTAVNQLMERFTQAQKMMRGMTRGGGMPGIGGGGGMPAMPGMGGMPGGGANRKKKAGAKKGRKGGKSGNPAKRAQEAQALQDKKDGKTKDPVGSAFGGVDLGKDEEFDPTNLPKGFGGMFPGGKK
ncbi:MAG: signal recognition particle protein, partial [Brevibacterium sp.]